MCDTIKRSTFAAFLQELVLMKSFFLIFSCLILILLCPVDKLDKADCANLSGDDVEAVCDAQEDILYDDDAITLLTTYDCQHDDVIPMRLNRWGRQLRVMTSRIQLQCNSHISMVKKITRLLSAYLTTLVHHNSQSYSTLKPLCWQYSVDYYVFAYRQIII